jgi:hypothetical protein
MSLWLIPEELIELIVRKRLTDYGRGSPSPSRSPLNVASKPPFIVALRATR